MRRTCILIALLTLAAPLSAKAPWVKKAQDLGFKDVTSCAACHKGTPKKDGTLADRGTFLVEQKGKKKAAEVDVAWLKDYKGK